MDTKKTIGMRVIAIAWATIALLMTIQLYLRLDYEEKSPSFWGLLLIQVLAWSIWLVLTPMIIQLGRKYRVSKANWKIGLLFHLPFSIISILIFLVCYVSIFLLVNQTPFSYSVFKGFYLSFYFQIFQWCWLIYWAIIGISYAVEYYERFRERELKAVQLEKDLSSSQLQALRMQLQPHFLFNTLHTIAAKVRLDEKQSAVKMLSLLSDLLRKVLQSSNTQLVKLESELAFLQEYLNLEQIRFKNRLTIQFEVDEAAKMVEVPNLILQPLVENAIKHGFSKKLDANVLKISATIQGKHLTIRVYNDGPPLPYTIIEGIGLSNIQHRLQRIYGEKGQFQIQNHHLGVEALISIPVNHE
ncbi:MAG: sensor histidine kinase [Flammeovirgaceae bacterium]